MVWIQLPKLERIRGGTSGPNTNVVLLRISLPHLALSAKRLHNGSITWSNSLETVFPTLGTDSAEGVS